MAAVTPPAMSKTSVVPPPLTTIDLVPGPAMVTSPVMDTGWLTTMGFVPGQETEKVTVVPATALPTTAGSEPAPEPLQFVTAAVVAPATAAGRRATEMATTPTMDATTVAAPRLMSVP